jgi:hypothetical protein
MIRIKCVFFGVNNDPLLSLLLEAMFPQMQQIREKEQKGSCIVLKLSFCMCGSVLRALSIVFHYSPNSFR